MQVNNQYKENSSLIPQIKLTLQVHIFCSILMKACNDAWFLLKSFDLIDGFAFFATTLL